MLTFVRFICKYLVRFLSSRTSADISSLLSDRIRNRLDYIFKVDSPVRSRPKHSSRSVRCSTYAEFLLVSIRETCVDVPESQTSARTRLHRFYVRSNFFLQPEIQQSRQNEADIIYSTCCWRAACFARTGDKRYENPSHQIDFTNCCRKQS